MGEILDGFDATNRESLIKQAKASRLLMTLPERVRAAIIKEVDKEYPDDDKVKVIPPTKEELKAVMDNIM